MVRVEHESIGDSTCVLAWTPSNWGCLAPSIMTASGRFGPPVRVHTRPPTACPAGPLSGAGRLAGILDRARAPLAGLAPHAVVGEVLSGL
jgi:hypothetical protein